MSDRIASFVVARRPNASRSVARAAFRELDCVETLASVEDEEGRPVPQGTTGTVVAVWADGAAFEVEFAEPVDALATIEPQFLRLVERAAD